MWVAKAKAKSNGSNFWDLNQVGTRAKYCCSGNVIIIRRFDISQFSALEQTHCAHVVIFNEWLSLYNMYF